MAAFRSGSGGLRRMDRRDSIHSVHDRCIYGSGPVGTVPSHARGKAATQRSARRGNSGGVERLAAVPAGGSSTGGIPGMRPRTCPAGRLGAPVRPTPGDRSLGQLPSRVQGAAAVENTAATPNETRAPHGSPRSSHGDMDACGRVGRSQPETDPAARLNSILKLAPGQEVRSKQIRLKACCRFRCS